MHKLLLAAAAAALALTIMTPVHGQPEREAKRQDRVVVADQKAIHAPGRRWAAKPVACDDDALQFARIEAANARD